MCKVVACACETCFRILHSTLDREVGSAASLARTTDCDRPRARSIMGCSTNVQRPPSGLAGIPIWTLERVKDGSKGGSFAQLLLNDHPTDR